MKENERLGDAVADEMEKVRGVADLGVFRSLGQPSIRVTTDRVRAARLTIAKPRLLAGATPSVTLRAQRTQAAG